MGMQKERRTKKKYAKYASFTFFDLPLNKCCKQKFIQSGDEYEKKKHYITLYRERDYRLGSLISNKQSIIIFQMTKTRLSKSESE